MDRIFVDLEKIGKKERQGHLDTLISDHKVSDIASIRNACPSIEILSRINPVHEGTAAEIEEVIYAGADLIMVPMFRTLTEIEIVCQIVAGRVGVIPLVETLEAFNLTDKLVKIRGIVEMYLGLNDLHLQRGDRFMFQPLADGLLDQFSKVLTKANIPFGFGGIARVGEGALPAEIILGEHVRLNSQSVILSRTFNRVDPGLDRLKEFTKSIRDLRVVYRQLTMQDGNELDNNRLNLKRIVEQIASM